MNITCFFGLLFLFTALFTKFSIDKTMLKQSATLAWPISLQNILVTMLSMVDIIMVGHLGDAAVASVGVGNRIQFVVLTVMAGLAWGVGILSSQYFGAGKSHRIRQTILLALIFSFIALAPILIANIYLADDLVSLASNDEQVVELGELYLWITMPSLLFVAVIIIFENALRSIGQVRLPMAFSALAIAINILLNAWLINGGLGVSALGVEGAAWATLLARIIHMLFLVGFLYYIKHMLSPRKDDVKLLSSVADWLHLYQLIWPMMLSFGVWALGTFIYQLIYGFLGTRELAVMSLIAPIEGVFIALFFGFSSACSIMVGQRLGANKFDEAWHIAKIFTLACPFIALLLGFIVLMAEPLILSPYANMAKPTLDMAHQVFLLIALGSWIKIFNMTLSMGVLRAGGDNRYCMYIDIIGMWIVSIPLTYYAAVHLQLPLIWVALVAYSEEICKVILFLWRVSKKYWLQNLADH